MSHANTKKHFISVPTLPLFMIESNKTLKEMNTSSSTAASAKMHSAAASTSSHHYEQPMKPERRRPKSEKSLELIATVHGLGKEHRCKNHKTRRKHRHVTLSDESFAGNVRLDSLSDEIQSSNFPSEQAISFTEGIPLAIQMLPGELERLMLENKELTRRIHAFEAQNQDSGYQNTITSSLETTIRKEEVSNLLEKLTEFENEYKALEKERNYYKNMVLSSNKQTANPNHSEKIKLLTLQNKELNEDILMLKNVVFRLNHELGVYQDRLRKLGGSVASIEVDSVEMPKEGIQVDRFTLAPLLVAYEEMIKEKTEIINNYERDITNFVGRCKDVVSENEKLHQEIEDMNKKSAATNEGITALHQDASITLEQNDLLNSQLKDQKHKLKEIHNVYRDKLNELSQKTEEFEDKYHRSRGELMTLKGSYMVLREEHEKLKVDSESKVPFSVHSASVTECRRLFDELKRKYDFEQSFMTNKVDTLVGQKPKLEAELVVLREENGQLETQLDVVEKMLQKAQGKLEETQNRLATTKTSKDAVKRQLQKAILFANELITDQEKLLQQLHSKQAETDTMAKLGSKLVTRMGSLKSKLKDVQQGAWQELEVIEKRITKQVSGVDKMKDEYRRETQRLQNLVKQKEEIIQRLKKEKSKTEKDLEVVWRAATSDGKNLDENLRRNFERNESPSDDRF